MNIFQAIQERRAIKYYDPTHRFTPEEENQLINLAMQTPSSCNLQHWRLVKVSDPELRQKIRNAAWNQTQVTDASLLFVITADMKAWAKNPERCWKNSSLETQAIMIPLMKNFYEGKEQLQRDEAMRSMGLLAQTMMLASKGMGYDSCPMIGFDPEEVAKIIRLPADHVIGMLLVIGKATKPAHPKPGFLEKHEFFIENHF
jgi:nitroreductase